MKKILIIGLVFAFSVSVDVGLASNVIKTEKQHDLKDVILSNNELMAADLVVVISDNLEYSLTDVTKLLTPVAVMPEPIIFCEPSISYLDYKDNRKLKNKVNNFHMFYRVKLC